MISSRFRHLFLFVLLVAATQVRAEDGAPSRPSLERIPVDPALIDVGDGDTVTIQWGDEDIERVRILGIDTLSIAIPAALTTSMAFILVTSSPTNVIPYSAGYFTIKDMAVAGVAITVVASVIVSVVIFLVGSMRGLY